MTTAPISRPVVPHAAPPRRTGWLVGGLASGLAAIAAACALAGVIGLVNAHWSDNPETAVKVVAVLFAVIVTAPAIVLFLRARATPAHVAAAVVASCALCLLATYIFRVSFLVAVPADILIWSESDFVNDIIKFRVGYPLYTDQANNESFTYVPGSQLLTYLIASLAGHGTSIPAYRAVQVVYTLLAAVFATLACKRLVELSLPHGAERPHPMVWGVVALPVFCLVASNLLTNQFTHNLHGDALAQLVTLVAYWLLVEYAAKPRTALLVAMAFVPAVGFLAKQSLVIWGPFYCLYLLCFDRPLNAKRLALFATAGLALSLAVIGAGYLLWREHFVYWIFFVLGKHGVSPLRSIQHLLDGWAYFAIGLVGGAVLLRNASARAWGLWVVWLLLLASETWSAGIAWMRNHMGPGSTVASIWFVGAAVTLWPRIFEARPLSLRHPAWLHAGMSVAVLLLLASGLGVVRVPVRPFADEPRRYVREIQRHFDEAADRGTVLLDFGSWVYFDRGIVMKDRAPSIGERGYSLTGDFSGILSRLNAKVYSKILVRDFHSPDFTYDHQIWSKPSGIRQAMLDNYREVETIRGIPDRDEVQSRYLFGDVTVLVPKTTPTGN